MTKLGNSWHALPSVQRLVIMTLIAVAIGALLGLFTLRTWGPQAEPKPIRARPETVTRLAMGRPTLGSGPELVLIEDFNCHGCKRFTKEVFPDLFTAAETGHITLVFVATSSKDDGQTLAATGQCVFDQNPAGFWAYKKTLFERQGDPSLDAVALAPVKDKGGLKACIETTGKVLAQENYALAKQLGVEVTPSILVKGRIHRFENAQTLLAASR